MIPWQVASASKNKVCGRLRLLVAPAVFHQLASGSKAFDAVSKFKNFFSDALLNPSTESPS